MSGNFEVRTQSAGQRLVIEAGRADAQYWRDLWAYRELFAVLAWRDVAVRYKQTVIGIAWALIQPLLTMVVFTFIFGRVAQLPSDGDAPYPVMVFAALLPWQLFATSMTQASNSVVNNSALVGKVYFPRLIVPGASAVVALVDFAISLAMLGLLMVVFGFYPDWRVVFLPLFLLLAVATAIGPAMWLSALNVKYRDFRYIVPFVVQFGMYVSPVGFSSSNVPEEWQFLYGLNPMVGVIDGFRWCLLAGEADINVPSFLLSLFVTAFFLWLGIRTFRKTEKTFADLL